MNELRVTRKIDELGRVVLPMEFRQEMDLESGNSVTLTFAESKIVIAKTYPCCKLCGGDEDLCAVKGKIICQSCITAITEKR